MTSEPSSIPARRPLARRILCFAIGAIAIVVGVIAYAWAAASFWWSPLGPPWMRVASIVLLLLAALLACVRLRGARRGLALVGIWLVPLAWFWFAPPANDANWQPASRIAPTIDVNGDVITVHGVRNFHWYSDEKFDERWDDRTYDLAKLRTLDVFLSYWGPTLICHTFVSFGFEDGQQLIVSVEVRRKVGEHYATVPSLFRMFELIYVFADELDVAYLRTNVWKESVHLFRVDAPLKGIRGLLVEYVERANRMAKEPEWYNAVSNSCGVNIIQNAWAEGGGRPLSWRLLFNGQWPRDAYEIGALDRSQPFDVVFARSTIDERAQKVGYSPEYSEAIRAGGVEVYTLPKNYDPTRAPVDPTG